MTPDPVSTVVARIVNRLFRTPDGPCTHLRQRTKLYVYDPAGGWREGDSWNKGSVKRVLEEELEQYVVLPPGKEPRNV